MTEPALFEIFHPIPTGRDYLAAEGANLDATYHLTETVATVVDTVASQEEAGTPVWEQTEVWHKRRGVGQMSTVRRPLNEDDPDTTIGLAVVKWQSGEVTYCAELGLLGEVYESLQVVQWDAGGIRRLRPIKPSDEEEWPLAPPDVVAEVQDNLQVLAKVLDAEAADAEQARAEAKAAPAASMGRRLLLLLVRN